MGERGSMAERRVYVVTQYASGMNRRTELLAGIEPGSTILVFERQRDSRISPLRRAVRRWPNPTRLLDVLGQKDLRWRLDHRLFFPSSTVLYARAAARAVGRELHRDARAGRRSVLITSVPPHDLLVIGRMLKRRHPLLRWIIDWRDLWSGDELYFSRFPLHKRSHIRSFERSVTRACDRNVVTNSHAKRRLIEITGVAPARVTVIPHAFEERDLLPGALPPTRLGNPIRIGFLGSFFKADKVPGERMLAALEGARRAGVDLRLEIVGDRAIERGQVDLRRHDWIVTHRRCEHRDALKRVGQCDFLLVFQSDQKSTSCILHAKIPPYLTMARPVLAVVPEPSAVADLVRGTRSGYVVPASGDWASGLAAAIRGHDPLAWARARDGARIDRYSWNVIRERWLQVLNGEDPCAIGGRRSADAPGARGEDIEVPALDAGVIR